MEWTAENQPDQAIYLRLYTLPAQSWKSHYIQDYISEGVGVKLDFKLETKNPPKKSRNDIVHSNFKKAFLRKHRTGTEDQSCVMSQRAPIN